MFYVGVVSMCSGYFLGLLGVHVFFYIGIQIEVEVLYGSSGVS